MDKKELLQKYYGQACHNLMCYSKNMLMTAPKEGYETEWQQAKEECNLLKEMIKESAQEVPVLEQIRESINKSVYKKVEFNMKAKPCDSY